ncbi:MAG TPA: GerMN domain-containing protein [Gaiellaceae bacterium]|nr:GerMN domain-containing protein [Gaiellaceae bacterium]
MRRIFWLSVLVAAVALLTAVTGRTYLTTAVAAEPAPRPVPEVPAPAPAAQPPSQTIRVYFVKGEQFAPVERRVAPNDSGAVAVRAVEWLLAGPDEAEQKSGVETTIPAGVTLESLTVDDGTVTLALAGMPTAPTAADVSLRPARAAQIVYTLTDVPGVERVLIDVDGTERATFVGSDLVVRGPLDQHDLSAPVRLAPQPERLPAGPAPVDIAGVQKRLATLRYLPLGAASGSWDYRTKQAVLAFQGWHGLARDGIVGPQTIAALETATRPEPTGANEGRRIEVHRAKGVVLLVDGRDVLRVVHASTGAAGYETPTGTYSVFRKETNSWSVPYQVWLPYASYFNGGIAFHASDDVPASPVSHGCVRLSAPEAPFVYEFAAVGTPVAVY